MDDRLLHNLLGHVKENWALVAITPDEVAELRRLGYVRSDRLLLTEAGDAKLTDLNSAKVSV